MTSYTISDTWRGQPIETFADIIDHGLDCVLVGLNPSPVSLATGHYMQGRLGRQFWRMLDQHGILPLPAYGRFPDETLLDNGFGFTDLVKRPTPRAAALTREDIETGREILRAKVALYRPKILCSVYKSTIEVLVGNKYPHQYGLLPDRFGDTLLFAAPFPYKPREMVERVFGELLGLLARVRSDSAAEAGKPRLRGHGKLVTVRG